MTTRQYAAGTRVPVERSKGEIQRYLIAMGALQRRMDEDDEAHWAAVSFMRAGVQYRIVLPLADPQDERFWLVRVNASSTEKRRTQQQAEAAWREDTMARWRALAAYIHAQLIAAQAHITTVERVLQPYAVVPGTGGQTVQEWIELQLPGAYQGAPLPPLLDAPQGVTQGVTHPRTVQAPG